MLDQLMRKQYDFSKGERGKFFRRNAKLNPPVYLSSDVRGFAKAIADKTHRDVSDVVNELLKSEMHATKAAR